MDLGEKQKKLGTISKKRVIIEAFKKALDQASFVLKENPELTFTQLYNRLQWQIEQEGILKTKLESERSLYNFAWLRLLNKPIESSALIRTFAGHNNWVNDCAFSPDSRRIVSASRDRTLKLWNAETGEELTTLKGHTKGVNDCAFSPDGSKIISASDDYTLKLWDTETGKELLTLKGHTYMVNACAFSPDGRRIVSASDDGTLKLWSAETGKELATLQMRNWEVFDCVTSYDGREICAKFSNNKLKLLDAHTEKKLLFSKGPMQRERPVFSGMMVS